MTERRRPNMSTITQQKNKTSDYTGKERLQLSESEELDILTGHRDISPETQDAFGELEEELLGCKANSEEEIAWVRKVVLPPTYSDTSETGESDEDDMYEGMSRSDKKDVKKGTHVAIEFMLPSRDGFWSTFKLPENHWDESNEFVQLLDTLHVSPGKLKELLGSEVDIQHRRGSWKVDLSAEEEGQTTREDREEAFIEWFSNTKSSVGRAGWVSIAFLLISNYAQHTSFYSPYVIVFSLIVTGFFALSAHKEFNLYGKGLKGENSLPEWTGLLSEANRKEVRSGTNEEP